MSCLLLVVAQKSSSLVGNLVGLIPSVCADDDEAAFLPKRRVRENHVHRISLRFQTVTNRNDRMLVVCTNSMKEKVHRTQARDVRDEIDSMQCPRPEMCSLLGVR